MNEFEFGSLARRKILLFIVVGFSFVIIFQLFNMQILKGSVYEKMAMENSVKGTVVEAPRGEMYDRNYKLILSNKPAFTLQITPAEYEEDLNSKIENKLHVDSGYVDQIFRENIIYSKFVPRKIKRDVNFDFIAWYEEHSEMLPGVEYIIDPKRNYSFGIKGSHLFGYTKEISAAQLKSEQFDKDYNPGDFIGATGIEKEYEQYLKGEKGVRYYLVDSHRKTVGRYLEGMNDKPPVKGNDLVLSIDADAQLAAEKMMEGKSGAVVAIEPATGEILAFVSAPTYDLSKFASVTSSDIWNELSTDEEKPLFNRATMSINPPGSTFKMLEALAALEEGLVSPSYSINCPGGYQFGDRFFKCTHVHGKVDMERSIEKSCNTYYYQLVLKLGIERWAKYSAMFGFGKKTGIDIPEEAPGILPSKQYYDKIFGTDRWPKGMLMSLGIGQGELSSTPVQLAQYASLLANFGKTKKPHLVKGYIDTKTQEFKKFEFDDVTVNISHKSFDIVREGMLKVVEGEGTARHIKIPGILIAGKTGTAQNPHGEDHALFIAFAPYENPKIAVAVIVENAGFGSTHAAPVAKEVIQAYLLKDKINGGLLTLSDNE